MRLRLGTRRGTLFVALLAIALVATLPLRLVMGWFAGGGLAARAASGSVWSGALTDAQLGGAPLGDLDARLSPVQLLVGRARIDLGRRGEDALAGALGVSRHTVGIDDVTGTLPAGALLGIGGIGAVTLDEVSMRFRDGTCERAEGRVTAALSGALGAGVQALSGDARCDGAAALLPLTDAAGAARLDVRLFGDGRYVAQVNVGGRSVPVEGVLR